VRLLLGLVVFAATVLPVPPAAAHTCAFPYEVAPRQRTTLDIGVPAEAGTVVAVDVGIPSGFRLDDVVASTGWSTERSGALVRFRGGQIAPFSCGQFKLVGTPTRKATYVFPLTVTEADGAVREFRGTSINDPAAAQIVYAGTVPEGFEPVPSSDGGRHRALVAAGIAVVAAAVGGGWWWRRRRPAVAPPGRR
jgi:hypothetical protein